MPHSTVAVCLIFTLPCSITPVCPYLYLLLYLFSGSYNGYLSWQVSAFVLTKESTPPVSANQATPRGG